MASVTVCIPAYKTGAALRSTIDSVLSQTFDDLCVLIGVEPADEETPRALERYSRDPRVHVRVNTSVLGWAENIRCLLDDVETPLFTILPHDDAYEAHYLERLHAALVGDPGAVVAYGDMERFGHGHGRKFMLLGGVSPGERLLGFFLEGAEAVPWRGLTRATVLAAQRFPVNEYESFAVECEWAAILLAAGSALRVENATYRKRTYGPDGVNVSRRWRYSMPKARLRDALDHHCRRMRALARSGGRGFPGAPSVLLACELATLTRTLSFLGDVEGVDSKLSLALERFAGTTTVGQREIESRAELLRAQIALRRCRFDEALERALHSTELDPCCWQALALLTRCLLQRGRVDEARDAAARLEVLAPGVASFPEFDAHPEARSRAT